LQDILRQPAEMSKAIGYLTGAGKNRLEEAAARLRKAPRIFLTGIGASWNAAIAAGSLLQISGAAAQVMEVTELLHFTQVPAGSVIVAISRTGRSVEILQLLDLAKRRKAEVVAVTNVGDSPLAKQASTALVIPVPLDHAISVNTYTTLAISAGALMSSIGQDFSSVASILDKTFQQSGERLETWRAQLQESDWFKPNERYYFLGRGGSLGTCNEARLLWEEGVKMGATAMGTSNFRHGPQEIVQKGMRFCLWIDQTRMRHQDLAVARDLRELGGSVMLIGENLPPDAGDLVCQLPPSPENWQFAIDVLPVQLAAEQLSRMAGVDCDSFRVCSYVVEDEDGLRKKVETTKDAS
jgi:glucosamine--fructose-6-phosphate aminotransferase (isomerizing)